MNVEKFLFPVSEAFLQIPTVIDQVGNRRLVIRSFVGSWFVILRLVNGVFQNIVTLFKQLEQPKRFCELNRKRKELGVAVLIHYSFRETVMVTPSVMFLTCTVPLSQWTLGVARKYNASGRIWTAVPWRLPKCNHRFHPVQVHSAAKDFYFY